MATGVIQGVWTDVGRQAMAQGVLGPLVRPPYKETFFKYFKIGEGGFVLGAGGSKSPKTPDPSLTDLESVSDTALYTFQKDFTAAELSYELDGSVPFAVAKAFLDFTEGNDDGMGESPEYFEIGIFDENDVMLIYATIPGETKNPSKTLNHIVKANF